MLAVVHARDGLLFATVDPWEIRSVGEVNPRPGSQVLPLRRLVRREKPTAIVAGTPRLAQTFGRAARVVGVPVLRPPPSAISGPWARALYPELPIYAPTRALEGVARLAIAAVLHSPIPARTYAVTRRRRTPAHPA